MRYICDCGARYQSLDGLHHCQANEHYRKRELTDAELIKRIQDALGTAETGFALVEVARNAHRTEQQLAAIELKALKQYAARSGYDNQSPDTTFGQIESLVKLCPL